MPLSCDLKGMAVEFELNSTSCWRPANPGRHGIPFHCGRLRGELHEVCCAMQLTTRAGSCLSSLPLLLLQAELVTCWDAKRSGEMIWQKGDAPSNLQWMPAQPNGAFLQALSRARMQSVSGWCWTPLGGCLQKHRCLAIRLGQAMPACACLSGPGCLQGLGASITDYIKLQTSPDQHLYLAATVENGR